MITKRKKRTGQALCEEQSTYLRKKKVLKPEICIAPKPETKLPKRA
jgi:hypothetical protein